MKLPNCAEFKRVDLLKIIVPRFRKHAGAWGGGVIPKAEP